MLLAGATALAVAACSAERSGPVGRAYHNLAARDNAYFMAREKLKEVEATLLKNMVSDYNKTLPVLVPINDQAASAVAGEIEDIVKKASLPIARHKNSNWTDDAYFLVGKARYYKAEFDEAEKVFKYVNTTGKEPNVRHAALVWLMRTFIQEKQIDNAIAVSDLLNKERGLPENARDLFLTRAQLAIIRQQPDTAILNLRLAIPEVPTKNERSRLRFILGQLYQQQGKDQLANEQYRKILRRNPPYELDLFTKLNLAQVTQLSDASGKAKIDKYLARLLKDFKNVEYRDKIYYEMARLEFRQQHYQKALELLGKSVRASGQNATQKPYSFLLAAQISYDKLRNYRLAGRYYDSTVQVLSPIAPEYPAAFDRKEILADFTLHYNVIERQDSLQELARLDTVELNRRLAVQINAELDRQEAVAARAAALAEAAERAGPAPVNSAAASFGSAGLPPGSTGGGPFGATNSTGLDLGTAATGAVWYFDNPASLGTARADFVRRWGNRTLQDNWRYSSLSQRAPAGATDKTGGLAEGARGDSTAAGLKGEAAAPELSKEQQRANAFAALRTTLLADLPKTPADFKKSDEQIEEALFQLARIYDERLHEPEYAVERYQELLNRFPATAHGPEALYALYLIAQRAKDAEGMRKWAAQLRTRFPKTEYAQLIDDPDYRQKALALNARVHVMYDSAFVIYREGLYPKARAAVALARRQYPVNDIADKLALLDAVLVGYTQPAPTYKAALEQFLVDYPISPLRPRADELLAAFNAPVTPSTATASADSAAATAPAPAGPTGTVYSMNKSVEHGVIVAYPQGAPAFSNLKAQLSDYHRATYSSNEFKLTSLLFGARTELVLVKPFEDSHAAMQYERKLRQRGSPLASLSGSYQLIVISLENLPKLYQSRDLAEYQAFYERTYKVPQN